MATQVYAADLTVPPGTTAAAPASLVVPQLSGWVGEVTLRIPRGPNGLAGWCLVLAGTVVIPYAGAGWIVGDDDNYRWPLNRWCNVGQLVVRAYNTGTYPHT